MMARPMLLVDLQRCIGCYSCTVACKQENDLPPGITWHTVTEVGPVGEFPNIEGYWLPHGCMHCEDPACVEACPTGASYQREDGIVLVDHDKCILCRYCMWACPYDARTFSEEHGMVSKCTMCAHLIDAGKEPACVTHCMGDARWFGDLDDPNSEIAQYLAANEDRAVHLLESQGTSPGLIYLEPKCGMLGDEAVATAGAKARS
jgi:DMSO reductase iron-sulfur subunit